MQMKEFELKRMRQADQEFKLDCVRKNQVIENMQGAFKEVLHRAIEKIRHALDLPKTTNIPTARMEICLDELARNFQAEINRIETFFSPD